MSTTNAPELTARERLQELHTKMVEHFEFWFSDECDVKLTAYRLSVLRAFLKDNGIVKDIESTKDVKDSLAALKDLSFPFQPEYMDRD